jgi:CheY-like chemotaxis protein
MHAICINADNFRAVGTACAAPLPGVKGQTVLGGGEKKVNIQVQDRPDVVAIVEVRLDCVGLNRDATADRTVVCTTDAEQAFRDIKRLQAGVVIVHLGTRADEAVRLIQFLASGWRAIHIIAVGAPHSEHVERRACAAGATVYLPNASPEQVAPVLAALARAHHTRAQWEGHLKRGDVDGAADA